MLLLVLLASFLIGLNMTLPEVEAKILIPADKANHVIWGAILSLVMTFFLIKAGYNHISPLTPVLIASIIGGCKELLDAKIGGDVSIWDFLATGCGGVFVAVTMLLF